MARLSLIGLMLVSIVAGRFAIDQTLTFEASNESPNIVELPLPVARETVATKAFDTAEQIEIDLSSEIQSIIDDFAAMYPDASFGIIVESVDESFSASLNQDQQFDSASLYKTLAAYKVLQLVDEGELKLDQMINSNDSLGMCIEKAIIVSDNPCGIALQKLANPTATDLAALSWGYGQTTLSGFYPQTSAQDQHRLFSDIYNGFRLTAESQDLLLSHLSNQKILNRTPAYSDAKLYLKTGDLDNVVNSSALIESSSSIYTISVLTDNWDIGYLSKYSAIEDIHRSIHEVITQNERPQ